MQGKLLLTGLVLGFLTINLVQANNKKSEESTTKTVTDTAPAATSTTKEVVANKDEAADEATIDKRQISGKDTPVYPNHRSDTNVDDDIEDPQETIYGPKPGQFLIRPAGAQPQLRNYPATIRPHNTQLLEQSQEIQHFAYLHDISRNQPKLAPQLQTKASASAGKKSVGPARAQLQQQQPQYTLGEEAEQRFAVAAQAAHQTAPRAYLTTRPYLIPTIQPQPQQQQQHQLQLRQQQQQQAPQPQQQQQQEYQIIPEEQFLKLLEEELEARAYHEAQFRQQQQHQQQQLPQKQYQQPDHATAAASRGGATEVNRVGVQGLGHYRQRIAEEPEVPEYVQYVSQYRPTSRYLQQPQGQAQQPQSQVQEQEQEQEGPPELPPQIAYYQPQLQQPIRYKMLPNHPLAKSSLEKEIEKLLAANKNSAAVQIVDNNAHESAAVSPQPHLQPQPQPQPQLQHSHLPRHKSAFVSSTTPNSLLDANNQPFIPSLFKFSGFQTPTPIYPTQVSVPQNVIDEKKLGPVVYPPQTSAPVSAQPSQYAYQETPSPSPKSKLGRSKQYGNKLSVPTAGPAQSLARPLPPPREKESKYAQSGLKYPQPLYGFEAPSPQPQISRTHQFFPSPPDPLTPKLRVAPSSPAPHQTPSSPQPTQVTPVSHPDYHRYTLPGPAPSQSSIYVSQGTGITTPSRPTLVKSKTAEDVKQLQLPKPGGKPLTQAEFQALVDAGYPVTAVPVPVPVPFEQYIKDHPEYRHAPPPSPPPLPVDYSQLMRLAHLQQRHVAAPSERAVKIISSPAQPQTATAIGGGSVTYLRPFVEGQKRRPRDEKETKVAGSEKDN